MMQVRLMREFGYVLGNLDATIILQRPKLSPHKEKIRANLCELLGADPSVVNIKVGVCGTVAVLPSRPKRNWAENSIGGFSIERKFVALDSDALLSGAGKDT